VQKRKPNVILNGVSREDNLEGECCKNEYTHFYNQAEELGLCPIQLSLVKANG
jgi:hypothetical protein